MKRELRSRSEQDGPRTQERGSADAKSFDAPHALAEVAQAYDEILAMKQGDALLLREAVEIAPAEETQALLSQLKELDKKSFQEIAAFVRESELIATRPDRLAFLSRIAADHPGEFGEVTTTLRLSTNEVFDFLFAQRDEVRLRLQPSLEQSGIKGKKPVVIESEQNFLKQVKEVEQNLLRALEAIAPERMEIEAKRSRIEECLRGEMTYQYELNAGSSSAPLAVLYEKGGPVGVYKSQVREPGFPDGAPIRSGIKPGEGVYREWITGLIGKALQVDVVPATVLRMGDEGLGSVKEWIPGESAVFTSEEKMDQASYEELAVLHAAITHCDGGQRNIHIRDQDGKAFSIDNDLCLSETPDLLFSGLQSDAVAKLQGKPLSEKRVNAIVSLVESKKAMNALEQAFKLAFQGSAPVIWKQFVNNLWSMVPDDPSEPVYLPKPQPQWGA